MEHEVSAVTRLTPRQRDWLEHLQAWERTGETLRAYAIARGLSVSGLYSARRDLIRRGAWRRERPPETTTAAPKFLPVRVTSPAPGAMFRVLLPNGTAVEVPEHADPVRTRALLLMATKKRALCRATHNARFSVAIHSGTPPALWAVAAGVGLLIGNPWYAPYPIAGAKGGGQRQ